MAWVHLLGRKFAAALTDPEFDLLLDWPYWNRFGRQGHSYYGSLRGRRFCISQSRRQGPDTMERLARVLRSGDSIDERIGPFFCNQKGQVGLVVAGWNAGQWLQMFSPGTPDQPRDDTFAELAGRIRADRTIDPQSLNVERMPSSKDWRLQELEDFFQSLRRRKDFQW